MFTLPDLPYDYAALEPFIDSETMHIHHDGHHATYVKNLNDILANYPDFKDLDIKVLMASLDKIPEEIRTKVRNNGGGHLNHSMFWMMMSPPANLKPEGKLLEAINLSFGDLTTFTNLFTQAGLSRFGSGWVWLISNAGKLEIVDTPNQDTPMSEGKMPILGLDVWEHAYYLKYKNKRADYITAWWNVVNWKKISENFELQTSSLDLI
jgi:Fe-Mn family superoxide dismutase